LNGWSVRSARNALDVPGDDRAVVGPELHRVAVGAEPLDGVPERVEEHPAPELAVGDHVEAEVDLALHRLPDRLVLDPLQLGPVGRSLLGEDGVVALAVEAVDGIPQRRRAEQRAHDLGPEPVRHRAQCSGLVTVFLTSA